MLVLFVCLLVCLSCLSIHDYCGFLFVCKGVVLVDVVDVVVVVEGVGVVTASLNSPRTGEDHGSHFTTHV